MNSATDNDGEDGDPVDDWASSDLTQLNEKEKINATNKEDAKEDNSIRSKTTHTTKKDDEK
jgi:hypothetical protein|tara:strand:+ start:100 stop:282 length:183 start_codon:yes stop_codon:yes gene_type:complete